MIRGLYTAAASMKALERKSDITANNLANSDTKGFKKTGTITESFPEVLLNRIGEAGAGAEIGEISSGSRIQRSFKDLSQGDLQQTGNPLDLALQGDGYFVVEAEAGIRYIRNGNFVLNADSEIVSQSGEALLDTEGERIQLIPGEDFIISESGEIRFNNGLQGAQIDIVSFADPAELLQVGDNLYQPEEGAAEPLESDARIAQGFLENSNVEIVKEMVNMIKTNRQYESNQKVISSIDQSLDKVINEVGRA
ncbi:MAG: flagellar hook-basal body protein [Halanaerobiales bacterium]|nr:flagellar hook-basal body protein [Halanaerobiales bacterium]